MRACTLIRLTAAWSLLLLDSIVILFALKSLFQSSSWNARLFIAVLILLPLFLILYLGFLLLRPPPPEVWSSIRNMKPRSIVRLITARSLLFLDSIAILFAAYVLTQCSWNARIVGAVVVLGPLLLILYLGFLLLRPPPPEVWSSIRDHLARIAKTRPVSCLLRPRWANISVVVLYLVATALLNSPSELEGMDPKSVVVSRQIPVAIQMALLAEFGALAPLVALIGDIPAYILLVLLGVAASYLLTSVGAHVLYLLFRSLAAVAGHLARWHGSGSGKQAGVPTRP